MSLTKIIQDARKLVRDLAVHTDLMIGGFAIAGALAFGIGGHHQQKKNSAFQSTAFSNYELLEDRALEGLLEMNKITWYYAATNDFANKIFEAYNGNSILEAPVNAMAGSRSWLFAYGLTRATDTTARQFRRNITDFGNMIPALGRAALIEMGDLRSARNTSVHLSNIAAQVWKYNFKEDGHLEPEPYCETDADGDVSCGIDWEYECDAHHYTWTFNPNNGLSLEIAMDSAASQVPKINRNDVQVADTTHSRNQDAIRLSFMRENDREPTAQEILQWSHKYSSGSQYEIHIDNAVQAWSNIITNERFAWRQLRRTARTTYIKTDCTRADAPSEYAFVEALAQKVNPVQTAEQAISAPINRTIARTPYIMSLIRERVARESDALEGSQDRLESLAKVSNEKLDEMIIDSTRAVYRDNFPGGLPTREYSFAVIFGLTLLGGAVGAGVGFAVDRTIETAVMKTGSLYRNR